MDLIYLDHNCFQRGFDDMRQTRIQMEALACQEIFLRAEKEKIQLAWSFMHEDETILCPFAERKHEVFRLAALCEVRLGPENEIYNVAQSFQEKSGLSPTRLWHFPEKNLNRRTVLKWVIEQIPYFCHSLNPCEFCDSEFLS